MKQDNLKDMNELVQNNLNYLDMLNIQNYLGQYMFDMMNDMLLENIIKIKSKYKYKKINQIKSN